MDDIEDESKKPAGIMADDIRFIDQITLHELVAFSRKCLSITDREGFFFFLAPVALCDVGTDIS